MFKNKTNPNPSALDGELENMEAGAAGRLLHTAGQQITPRAEFVQQLEDRIGVDATAVPRFVPEPVQPYKPEVVHRRDPSLAWSRVRLSMVGVGLSLAMVVVLGLSMFYTGSGRSGISDSSTVPQPTFPPALGESVLIERAGKSGQYREILPIDPETGKSVPGYAPFIINASYGWQTYTSRDGTKLAAIESMGQVRLPWAGGHSIYGSADLLRLVDVQAWREVTATLSSKDAVERLSFSADGSLLVLALSGYKYDPNRTVQELVVIDARTGGIVARQELDIRPSRLEFSLDGARLIVYGQRVGSDPGMDKPGPLRVMLLDATTLETEWDYTLEDIISGTWCESNCDAPHAQQVFALWNPSVTFSHDRSKIYIVHADEEKLTTVDLTAHNVHSTEIAEQRSWFEDFLALTARSAEAKGGTNGVSKVAVLSLDGRQLYVTGRRMNATREQEQESLDLQVVEVENGLKSASYESDATWLGIAPYGPYLYLSGSLEGDGRGQRVTDILDTKSFELVARIEKWGVGPVKTLGGKELLVAVEQSDEQTQFAIFDPQSFKVTDLWSVDGRVHWLARP